MEIYETIKKILADDGKCLLIEDGKPIGIVLTVEEYEKLKENKSAQALQPSTLEVGAELADIALTDDITLEDLGLFDELP